MVSILFKLLWYVNLKTAPISDTELDRHDIEKNSTNQLPVEFSSSVKISDNEIEQTRF